MIKETITYIDYDGNERTEDFYFNLNESETMKLELGEVGTLTEKIKRIISARNVPEIMKVFDELISISYGEKSPDGREFVKSEELSKKFMQTEAYNKLFMRFVTEDGYAAKFFEAIIPSAGAITELPNA